MSSRNGRGRGGKSGLLTSCATNAINTTEMNAGEDELGQEFIHNTFDNQNPSVDDDIDIEIKHEEVDFHRNTTSHSDSEGNSDGETVPKIVNVVGSDRAEEKDANELYLDLSQCQRDCETCQKYLVILSKHVRETHNTRHSVQDTLPIDPLILQAHQPSSIQIKKEKNEDTENMKHSEQESESRCDYDTDYEFESGSDPDYSPSTRLTRNTRRQGHLVKNHTSSDSTTSKAKKGKLPSRKLSKCNVCGESVRGLRIHMRIHTGERPYSCPPQAHQSSSIPIKSKMDEGIENIDHSDQESESIIESDPEFDLEGGGESDPDYSPSTRLTRSASRQCQLAKTHTSSESTTSMTKKKKLPSRKLCGKSVRRLTDRMRIHIGEKPFKCHECKKSFSQSSNLNNHKRIHRGVKPYKCDECDSRFTRLDHLTLHMNIHAGVKPYKCTTCEKSFSDNMNLTKHVRVHTGERPYKCNECRKSFSQSSNLKRHKRSHTKEKPFKCDECEKSFSQSGNLKLHKSTHTGVKPYKCGDCQKSFSVSHHLVNHKRIHTGEKPYKCEVCKKTFARLSHLKKHLRSHT